MLVGISTNWLSLHYINCTLVDRRYKHISVHRRSTDKRIDKRTYKNKITPIKLGLRIRPFHNLWSFNKTIFLFFSLICKRIIYHFIYNVNHLFRNIGIFIQCCCYRQRFSFWLISYSYISLIRVVVVVTRFRS